MKFVFPLCMLVALLVCCEAKGRMKVYAEGCTESDFSEEQLTRGCGKIVECAKFENGTIRSYSSLGCGQSICSDGSEPLPGDPTKAYPDCCAFKCS